jgi:hypothetical protein
MDAKKTCVRCGGKMFLEFDYDTQGYDFVCISCGHAEPSGTAKSNSQNDIAGLKDHQPRKVRDLSRI